MNRILVLEDEEPIREFVVINLERAGYSVIQAKNSEEALQIIEDDTSFDIAILDVMLPDGSGFDILKKLREKNDITGIIMLTARTMEQDKIEGFDLGADDYVTKPFSPSELIARVNSLYRRVLKSKFSSKKADSVIQSGPFYIDCDLMTAKKNGEVLDLTQIEFNILKYILQNKGTALSRQSILKTVWGNDYYGDLKIVDVNIRRLRMKIEENPSSPSYILTIWGYGYKWGIN